MTNGHNPKNSSYPPTPRQPVRQEVFELLKSHDRGFTTGRISELIDSDVTSTYISRILRRMASDGLVERIRSPMDGRKMVHSGTKKLDSTASYRAEAAHVYFNNGYSVISHHHKGEKYLTPTHRLVAVAEYGIKEVRGKHVHHKNKHPIDNRPENLCPMEPGLHRKADAVSAIKLSTNEEEFERILEMAEEANV